MTSYARSDRVVFARDSRLLGSRKDAKTQSRKEELTRLSKTFESGWLHYTSRPSSLRLSVFASLRETLSYTPELTCLEIAFTTK